MEYKKDEVNRKNIELSKTDIEISYTVPLAYLSNGLSSSSLLSSSASFNVPQDIRIVIASNKGSTIERPEMREIVADTTANTTTTAAATASAAACSTVFADLNGIQRAFYQDGVLSMAIPATICSTPSILQDIEDHSTFLSHIRGREKFLRPYPFYLNQQLEIDEYERTVLVNWLVSVVNEFHLESETLYLTIAYVDQFLSHILLPRCRLLLMGITAIFVAAKFEESNPPSVTEFAVIGGIEFDAKDIIKMEQLLLTALSYDLHIPTAYTFTTAFALLTNSPHLPSFLALYLCELSLLETEPYLQFLPSQISAASHALARYLLGYTIWSKELEKITSYRVEDLKRIAMLLCETHFRAQFLLSSTKLKFMEEKYHQVALIDPLSMNEFPFDQIVEKYYLLN